MTLEELAKMLEADAEAEQWESMGVASPEGKRQRLRSAHRRIAAAAAIRELQNKRDNCSGICSKILESETDRLLGEIKL